MSRSRQIKAIRAALDDLANDSAISDRARLRALELIETDICGLIADLQARLPKRVSEDDLDGGSARMSRAG